MAVSAKTVQASPLWADGVGGLSQIGIVCYRNRPDQRPFSSAFPQTVRESEARVNVGLDAILSVWHFSFLSRSAPHSRSRSGICHVSCCPDPFYFSSVVPVALSPCGPCNVQYIRILCDCDSDCPSINPASKSSGDRRSRAPDCRKSLDPTSQSGFGALDEQQ